MPIRFTPDPEQIRFTPDVEQPTIRFTPDDFTTRMTEIERTVGPGGVKFTPTPSRTIPEIGTDISRLPGAVGTALETGGIWAAENTARAVQHGLEYVVKTASTTRDPFTPGITQPSLPQLNDKEIRSIFERAEPIPGGGGKAAQAVFTALRTPDMIADVLQAKREEIEGRQPKFTFKESPITYVAERVAKQLPTTAVAFAASVFGGPGVGLAVMGFQEFGNAAEQQARAGASINQATAIGGLSAAAEIGGEMLVFPRIFKGIKAGGFSARQIADIVLENAGQETVTGFFQQAFQTFGEENIKGTDTKKAIGKAVLAGLAAIPENAWVGGLSAGVTTTSITAAGKTLDTIKHITAVKETLEKPDVGAIAIVDAKIDEIQQDTTIPEEQKKTIIGILGNIAGDWETKIIEKIPGEITDLKSLEEWGNKVAKELGVDKILEELAKKHGIQPNIVWQISKRNVQKAAHAEGPEIGGTRDRFGVKIFQWDRVLAIEPIRLKKTIIHELGHFAQRPRRTKTGRIFFTEGRGISKRQVHHPEFKSWVDASVKNMLQEKRTFVPRKETVSQEVEVEPGVTVRPMTREEFFASRGLDIDYPAKPAKTKEETDAIMKSPEWEAHAEYEGLLATGKIPMIRETAEGAAEQVPPKPFKAIVYRGISDKTPIASGFAKGTHYTTDKKLAQSFAEDYGKEKGKLIETEISLTNPLYLTDESQFGAEALDIIKGEEKKGTQYSEEERAQRFAILARETLEKQGYDGIVYSGGKEIIVFAQQPPGEIAAEKPTETKPAERAGERGANITGHAATYQEAITSKRTGVTLGKNVWIRPSVDADNSKRTLLIQFASEFMNAGTEEPAASEYYAKLHAVRKGYIIPEDFWEIPKWIAEMANTIPESDVYVVRDINEAKQFLQESGYGIIAFSALDVNKNLIKDLAKDFGGRVAVGGYVDKIFFDDTPNITFYDSPEDYAKKNGIKYVPGTSYRHFKSTPTQARLCMSKGCLYNCTFCVVSKGVITESSKELIDQQVESFKDLHTELVYIDDKTFGQAGNFEYLTEVYKKLKKQNPEFRGFIVQTAAAKFSRMDDAFLKRSGIKYVELGIESYNDKILRPVHKPATERNIDKSVEKIRKNGLRLIPNIIIGLPGETAETYQHTLDFLEHNADIISHINAYNLALYAETEMAKKITAKSELDLDENQVAKSFHANPQLVYDFADRLYDLGKRLLDKTPGIQKTLPAPAMAEKPKGKRPTVRRLQKQAHKIARDYDVDRKEYEDLAEQVTGKRSMKDMDKDQMIAFVDALKETYGPMTGIKADDLDRLVYHDGKWVPLRGVLGEVVTTVTGLPDLGKGVRRVTVGRVGAAVKKLVLGLWRLVGGVNRSRPGRLSNMLGGFKDTILTRIFQKNLIQDGSNHKADHIQAFYEGDLQKFLAEKGFDSKTLAKISRSQWRGPLAYELTKELIGIGLDRIDVKFGERTYSITRDSLCKAYLQARQPEGMAHLLEDGGVLEKYYTGPLTKEEVLRQIIEPAERDPFCVAMAEFIDQHAPNHLRHPVNEISVPLVGKAIATKEMYFPLDVEETPRYGKLGFKLKTKKPVINLFENPSCLLARKGPTGPLRLDGSFFDTIHTVEEAVSDYVAYAPTLRLVLTILGNKEVVDIWRQKGYGDVHRILSSIIESEMGSTGPRSAIETALAALTRGTARGLFHWNLKTAGIQYSSLMLMKLHFDAKYRRAGIKGMMSHKMMNEFMTHIPWAWTRMFDDRGPQMIGGISETQGLTLPMQGKYAANQIGIWGLKTSDLEPFHAIFWAAIAECDDRENLRPGTEGYEFWHDKPVLEKGTPGYWALIRERYTMARQGQQSYDKFDRSMNTSRKDVASKLAFLFQSFHEGAWNVLQLSWDKLVHSEWTKADLRKFRKAFGAVFASYATEQVMRDSIIMVMMFAWAGIRRRKPKAPLEWYEWILRPFISILDAIPIFGNQLNQQVRNFTRILAKDKPLYSGRIGEPLPLQIVDSLFEGADTMGQGAAYCLRGETKKGTERIMRGFSKIVEKIALTQGVPTYEIKRIQNSIEKPTIARPPVQEMGKRPVIRRNP